MLKDEENSDKFEGGAKSVVEWNTGVQMAELIKAHDKRGGWRASECVHNEIRSNRTCCPTTLGCACPTQED